MKELKITKYPTLDEALEVAKETTHQFSWYTSSSLTKAKKINAQFNMKHIVTESLEVYNYHDKSGYNYMTKFDAGGSLTNSRPRICVLKLNGNLIVTKLTVDGNDKKFQSAAKLAHKSPSSLKHALGLNGIGIEEGDIIIWTKESFDPNSYHKK
jgi:hypothetical protein